ncbi:MAG: VanW family protein [Anaerolineales bacterium]|nr:VanW family protein [Anaerolineales bacterium]MCX7756440.1 VanW family protein [Anaerolineales bacterium]MDW8277733.1 VanW family protein [Anaerolineales bacterium]
MYSPPLENPSPVRFVRPRRDRRQFETLVLQLLLAVLGGVAAFFIVMFLITIGYRVMYAGRIFPGISVAGVELSGLKPEEAAVKLQTLLTYPVNGRIVLRDGDQVWIESPARLGMVFDPLASAQAAFDTGRKGGLFGALEAQWNASQTGINVPPVIVLDQRLAHSYLQNLATQIDRPVREASLVINGLEVTVTPGQIGRRLNVDATLVYLTVQMQSFRDGEVRLVIEEQAPAVLDASPQAEVARRLLSAPFTLSIPNVRAGDPGPWQIQPLELAPMLRVGRVSDAAGNTQYVIQADRSMLKPYLENIARQTDRPEQNARFIFDETTAQLQLIRPATIGYKLDFLGTLEEIENAVAAGQNAAYLRLIITEPQVKDDATAAELGITQLVSSQTTYFYGSSAPRLQNIQAAAANFHGVLVAPGETFSMGKYLGDISLDNGYAEALIIYGGRTIKGVGGGVCQVSTTLFRTAFFGGYPINERFAHAYRVSYYEQRANGSLDPRLAGFDATVYFPLVDFKFTNDTPYWLLMEVYFNGPARTLTWKFYSTSDGRTVTYDTTGPINVVPAPPPVIQVNEELNPGEVRQVDWAAEGADVIINRVVMRDGKIYFVDKFQTHYEPWRAVCEYGPGTEDPEKILRNRNLCQP